MSDILPDCRTRDRKGSTRSAVHGNIIPVYCANCGVEWGRVPEQMITCAFVLCQPCADKHGDIAHTYKEPDHVFWERVAEAQQEEFGGPLSFEQLAIQLDDPTSVLAGLADEWRTYVLKLEK